MKRWTQETAHNYIRRVNSGKIPFGITFCSACDFLKISVKIAYTRTEGQ
jgi:hypothetical protein